MKKVLKDNDFWKALDKTSGNNWAVFSIKPKKGKMETPMNESGYLSMMVAIWKEPKDNIKLLKEFNLKDTSNLPLLLIVSRNENDEILKCEFPINDSSIANAYKSLKEGLEIVSSTLSFIEPKNKNNDQVYMNVKGSIQHNLIWKKIHKGTTYVTWIKDLLPFFFAS